MSLLLLLRLHLLLLLLEALPHLLELCQPRVNLAELLAAVARSCVHICRTNRLLHRPLEGIRLVGPLAT